MPLIVIGGMVALIAFAGLVGVEVKHYRWRKACDAIDSEGRPVLS